MNHVDLDHISDLLLRHFNRVSHGEAKKAESNPRSFTLRDL
jgi:hypothetical protein